MLIHMAYSCDITSLRTRVNGVDFFYYFVVVDAERLGFISSGYGFRNNSMHAYYLTSHPV